MLRKLLIFCLPLVLIISVGCVTQPPVQQPPVKPPTLPVEPVQPPVTPGVDRPPVVVPAPDQPVAPAQGLAISRSEYDAVRPGMSVTELQNTLNGRAPLMRIPQPDGGVALRYRVLDSDGQWRNRHANFVFSRAGSLTRKSIS
jgi:hypothetical protein